MKETFKWIAFVAIVLSTPTAVVLVAIYDTETFIKIMPALLLPTVLGGAALVKGLVAYFKGKTVPEKSEENDRGA
jgi:hypothetical protein